MVVDHRRVVTNLKPTSRPACRRTNWVWSDSHHVADALGWDHAELRIWLAARGRQLEGARKPLNPKETVELALREKSIPRSSAVYRKIAEHVSFDRCEDLAFLKLRTVLQSLVPNLIGAES
jgi:hypothetical protein